MGTLKTTDLPVGSWVRHEGREAFVASISISAPDYSPLVMLMDQGYLFWGNVPIESLEPIPITPEILEANGWSNDGMYARLRIDGHRHLEYYYHEHRLRKWCCCVDEWENHAKVDRITVQVHCYHVHQLQQALRLAGVDKEIVMPNK